MRKYRGLLQCTAFWLLFAVVFVLLTQVFIYKDVPEDRGKTFNSLETNYNLSDHITGYYALPRNSLDVVFVGSSLVHCGINPNVIWRECGFSSYDLTSAGMELDTVCYAVAEAVRTQNPEVVAVEATYFDADNYNRRASHGFYTAYSPLSLPKLSLALGSYTENEAASIIAPLTLYHTRWSELTENDWKYPIKDKSDPLLGFVGIVKGNENAFGLYDESVCADAAGTVSEATARYVDELQNICERGKARLVFIVVPSSEGLSKSAEINAFCEYLGRRGIDCINYGPRARELGLISGDVADPTHLTVSGAEKFSAVIGSDIAELYGISGNSGQEYADYFDRCADEYERLYAEVSKEMNR